MKIKKLAITIIVIALVIFYFTGIESATSVEEYDIISGFGGDVKIDKTGTVEYSVPYGTYVFPEENVGSTLIRTGRGTTLAETRESRQLYSSRVFLVGDQKMELMNQEYAEKSLAPVVSILFSNPRMNDRSYICVTKDNTGDVLRYKVEGYESSAEFLQDMMINARDYNFFSKEYTILNMYVRLDTEGRNLVLPYIEITDKGLELTGMAMFKGDRMVNKLNMEEARVMNMLRENKVKGILTIEKDSKRYINYYAKTKKKIICNKKDNRLEFIIKLKLSGDIVTNTLYDKLDMNFKKDFEEKIGRAVEQDCNKFIDKMKNEYKVDFLELGVYGITKYGRDTAVDWNEVISNSDIKVVVEAKVDKIGRGEY